MRIIKLLCSSISTEYLKHLEQVIAEMSFEENNVTIGIYREDLPYSYCNSSFKFAVTPHATIFAINGNATVTLSYNALYNLTVLGSLCGYTSSVSLSYGELCMDDH